MLDNPYAVLSKKLGPAGAMRVSTWLASKISLAKEKQGELYDIAPLVSAYGMTVWLEVKGCYETDGLVLSRQSTVQVSDRKLFQDCITQMLCDMSDGWTVNAG